MDKWTDGRTDSAPPPGCLRGAPTTSTCPSPRHPRKGAGQGMLQLEVTSQLEVPLAAPERSQRWAPCFSTSLANSHGQDLRMARIAGPWVVGAMHGECQDTLEASWCLIPSDEKSQQVEQDHHPVAPSWVRGSSCNPGQRLRRTSTTRTRFKAAPTPAPQHPTQLPGTGFPQHSQTCCSLHQVTHVN